MSSKKEETQAVSRRKFINQVSVTLLGIGTLGITGLELACTGSIKTQKEASVREAVKERQLDASSPHDNAMTERLTKEQVQEKIAESKVTESKTADQNPTCQTTEDDILGPYYCSNAPWRTSLVSESDPGTRLFISGVVMGSNCKPLANAIVEVWQADSTGNYFNSCKKDPKQSKYKHRARLKTNAKGEYAFESVKPGNYDQRPSHIHYKVVAQGHSELVTQLYFKGDRFIKTDPFAKDKTTTVIPLQAKGKAKKGTFDITLKA